MDIENETLQFHNPGDMHAFMEPQTIIEERLLGLYAEWIEAKSKGLDPDSGSTMDIDAETDRMDYGPDDILISTKFYTIEQVLLLAEREDIEMYPDFQRNFVWDRTRQSRLIESVFLGLPLPSFYLSQYNDGRLTVVDGLQRLNAIRLFYNNQLRLCNLEYLHECEGHTFEEVKSVISPLRVRNFMQTQLTCYVIDHRSPQRLKYDLFKRLNTGGMPLNNQEIRNCLSCREVKQMLRDMTQSREFEEATTGSIKNLRLDTHEAALRFCYFYQQFEENNPTGSYKGNIESALNDTVDWLNAHKGELQTFCIHYSDALRLSQRFFGEYAFRKVYDGYRTRRRSAINKVLMLCTTVLFARYYDVLHNVHETDFTDRMVGIIDNNEDFFNAITWGTTSRNSIDTAFRIMKQTFIDPYIL